MHQKIYTLGGLLNRGNLNKTRGLTGLIYKTIRKTTDLSAQSYAFAAHTGDVDSRQIQQKIVGDALVSVDSALGRHSNIKHSIHFPKKQQFVFNQINHMDLLSNHAVYTQIETIFNQSA